MHMAANLEPVYLYTLCNIYEKHPKDNNTVLTTFVTVLNIYILKTTSYLLTLQANIPQQKESNQPKPVYKKICQF